MNLRVQISRYLTISIYGKRTNSIASNMCEKTDRERERERQVRTKSVCTELVAKFAKGCVIHPSPGIFGSVWHADSIPTMYTYTRIRICCAYSQVIFPITDYPLLELLSPFILEILQCLTKLHVVLVDSQIHK